MTQPLHTTLRQLRRLAAAEPTGVSDAQLLQRFVATREEAAFELLVWRHERMVLGVCRRVLGDVHDAEDAFQATFLALARRAATISRGDAVGSWLYRVALRAALRARGRAALPVAPLPAGPGPPSPGLDPSDAAAWRELRPLLDDEVGRLPEKYRTPIVLCYLEGKTYDEAARDLGCPRGTVSIRLTRARELLRKRLVRRGLVLSAVVLADLLTSAGADASGGLITSTVQRSILFAAGTVATVPAPVLALTEGVLRAMSTSKLKVIVGGLLLTSVLAAGAGGVLAQRSGKAADPVSPVNPEPIVRVRAGNAPEHSWGLLSVYETRADNLSNLAFSPDGKRLACVDTAGNLSVLEVPTGKAQLTIPTRSGPLVAVAFSPDGRVIAVGGGDPGKPGTVGLWDAAGAEKITFRAHDDTVTDVAFSPDGRLLVTAGVEGVAQLVEAATGQKVRTFTGHKDAVFSVAFSPDGRLLVTGGGPDKIKQEGNAPGDVKVWDSATGKQVRQLGGHKMTVSSVAFSPDGRLLATGSFDSTVRLWDAATGKELTQLRGHEFYVRRLAFSPDGKLLATAGFDETARIWDVATGKEVAVLRGHTGLVVGVAFSPDGRYLATCSSSMRFKAPGKGKAEVRIWKVGPTTPDKAIDGDGGLAKGAEDRLEQLVSELLKSQRGDEACVEALTLATLGRLPTEAERKFAAGELSRSQDRRKTLSDVLFTLTSTREFKAHAADLARRAAQK